jgi:hypothetical protein
VLSRGTPYQIRDLDGQPITRLAVKKMIKQLCTVPAESSGAQRSHESSHADPLSAGGPTLPILR